MKQILFLMCVLSFTAHARQGDGGIFTGTLFKIIPDGIFKKCTYRVDAEYLVRVDYHTGTNYFHVVDSEDYLVKESNLGVPKVSTHQLRIFDCPENKTFQYNWLERKWREI